MSKEEVRTIPSEVSKECWKKLKVMSIQKEITLSKLVRDILEKHVSNKRVSNGDELSTSE